MAALSRIRALSTSLISELGISKNQHNGRFTFSQTLLMLHKTFTVITEYLKEIFDRDITNEAERLQNEFYLTHTLNIEISIKYKDGSKDEKSKFLEPVKEKYKKIAKAASDFLGILIKKIKPLQQTSDTGQHLGVSTHILELIFIGQEIINSFERQPIRRILNKTFKIFYDYTEIFYCLLIKEFESLTIAFSLEELAITKEQLICQFRLLCHHILHMSNKAAILQRAIQTARQLQNLRQAPYSAAGIIASKRKRAFNEDDIDDKHPALLTTKIHGNAADVAPPSYAPTLK